MYKKTTLVADNIKDGAKLLEKLKTWLKPIWAAFWLRAEEGEDWRLVVISPVVGSQGPKWAYQQLPFTFFDLKNDPTRAREFTLTPDDVSILSPGTLLFERIRRASGADLLHESIRDIQLSDAYIYWVEPDPARAAPQPR